MERNATMRSIKEFCGHWSPEIRAIQFKWDVTSIGNDRYIYIVGLKEENGVIRPDKSKTIVFDIRDMRNTNQSTTNMQIKDLKTGVYKMLFCAYSMPQAKNCTDDEIMEACKSDPSFTTTVVMGKATISYTVDYKVVDNSKITKILIKSDSIISEGVLGYKYCIDNCEITNAFPKEIKSGKTLYPPVLIPKSCEIQITPLDRQFSGNLSITYKKNKFLF